MSSTHGMARGFATKAIAALSWRRIIRVAAGWTRELSGQAWQAADVLLDEGVRQAIRGVQRYLPEASFQDA
jgi:hypothetical protein